MSVWYFMLDGEPTGPLTTSRLVEFCRLGVFDEDTLIWREGEAQWRPFSEIYGNVKPQAPAVSKEQVNEDEKFIKQEKQKYQRRGVIAALLLFLALPLIFIMTIDFGDYVVKGKDICHRIDSINILESWKGKIVTKFDSEYVWVNDEGWKSISYDAKISIALAHFCRFNPSGVGSIRVRGSQSGETLALVINGNFLRQ
jgi:hypothetical protein